MCRPLWWSVFFSIVKLKSIFLAEKFFHERRKEVKNMRNDEHWINNEQYSDYEIQKLFLSLLHCDNRNGEIIIEFISNHVASRESIHDDDIRELLRKLHKCDYRQENVYVTVNSFARSYVSDFVAHRADRLFAINGYYFDLDAAEHDKYDDSVITATIRCLMEAIDAGLLCPLTMITMSGRGLGLFIQLRYSIPNIKSCVRSIRYYDYIYRELAKRIKTILDSYPKETLVIDVSCVADHARIVRLPRTMNQAAGRKAELIYMNTSARYELDDIVRMCGISKSQKRKKDKENAEGIMVPAEITAPYLQELLKNLKCLQQSRASWEGLRETFCFIFYNLAKQVMSKDEARVETFNFAKNFPDGPFDMAKLEKAYKSVDSFRSSNSKCRGYYPINALWIINKLELTREEIEQFKIELGGGWVKRNYVQKIKNIKKKIERDRVVIEAIMRNKKYEDVVKQTGVPLRTVKQIAKTYGVSIKSQTLVDINWDELYQKRLHKKSAKSCTSGVVEQYYAVANDEDLFNDDVCDIPANNLDELSAYRDYAMSFLYFCQNYFIKGYKVAITKFIELIEEKEKEMTKDFAVIVYKSLCIFADLYMESNLLENCVHELAYILRIINEEKFYPFHIILNSSNEDDHYYVKAKDINEYELILHRFYHKSAELMFELKEAEDDWEMLIHAIASSINDEATIKGVYSLAKLQIGDSKKKEIEKILTNDENIEEKIKKIYKIMRVHDAEGLSSWSKKPRSEKQKANDKIRRQYLETIQFAKKNSRTNKACSFFWDTYKLLKKFPKLEINGAIYTEDSIRKVLFRTSYKDLDKLGNNVRSVTEFLHSLIKIIEEKYGTKF